MPNDDYDALFDGWGKALNVNPQLGKTVFHLESNGDANAPDGPPSPNAPLGPDGRPERAQGGMQLMPSTARGLAVRLGLNPDDINLRDMRWAVPLGLAYLAEGLNATQSVPGALAYYFAGPNTSQWGDKTRDYVRRGLQLYPQMALTPAAPQAAPAQEPGP